MTINKSNHDQLATLAWKAREQSYSPYSKRQVGAAILVHTGQVFTGCNIENASFGGTVCAERVAIWKAVSEIGPDVKVTAIAVATDADPAWPPCDLCRQVANEFRDANFPIYLVNASGIQKTYSMDELLPHAFDKEQLQD
jgi:cytidine deaminase